MYLLNTYKWCWKRLFRVPCTARRSNQSVLNEINPEYWLEVLMLKLKLQYSGHLIWRADSLEKTSMLREIEGRRRSRRQRMRRLDAFLTQWIWIWANSGDSEGQGSLATGSERVARDLATGKHHRCIVHKFFKKTPVLLSWGLLLYIGCGGLYYNIKYYYINP